MLGAQIPYRYSRMLRSSACPAGGQRQDRNLPVRLCGSDQTGDMAKAIAGRLRDEQARGQEGLPSQMRAGLLSQTLPTAHLPQFRNELGYAKGAPGREHLPLWRSAQ